MTDWCRVRNYPGLGAWVMPGRMWLRTKTPWPWWVWGGDPGTFPWVTRHTDLKLGVKWHRDTGLGVSGNHETRWVHLVEWEELTGRGICKGDREGILQTNWVSLGPREQSFKERVLSSSSTVERDRGSGTEQYPLGWNMWWLLLILMTGVSGAHYIMLWNK